MSLAYDQQKADNAALKLLLNNGLSLNRHFPADPFELAESLGLVVGVMTLDEIREMLPDADDETSGFLYRPGKMIVVRAEDAPSRQRFTVAHEIGHYLMHSDLITDFVRRNRLSTEGVDAKEMEANRFAAALLMPEFAFIPEVNSGKTVSAIAERFGVSNAAVVNRATALRSAKMPKA